MQVSERSPPDAAPLAGARPTGAPSTILFIVWPEPGHVAGPLALARRLQARGDRVVFGGLPEYRPFIERYGREFCDLAAPAGDPPGPSVFACPRSEPALAEAVRRLVAAFADACTRYAPAAVLIDSLYSAFALLPASRGLPWATYETDLPRELDLGCPALVGSRPLAGQLPAVRAFAAQPADDRAQRRAWAGSLWATYRQRRDARRSHAPGLFSLESEFPDRLCSALRQRVGDCVDFDRRSAFTPVAQGPRLVFASESLDFPRRGRHGLSYGGPCIDTTRREPDFEWSRLPPDKALVYCSLGTQSFREERAPALLRSIIGAVSRCPDLFLVVACPAKYAQSSSGDPDRTLFVKHAPQLALLRRASLAITHAGFNSVKECALFGVPQLVLPLSHDQPRNAVLVERLGIGFALCPSELSEQSLLRAMTLLRTNGELSRRCQVLRRRLQAENAAPGALEFIDRLLLGQGPGKGASFVSPPPTANRRSLMQAFPQETPHERAVRLSCASPRFERIADDLVSSVRRAMGVPDRAEPEVEQEFAALRATLDQFYPEFTQLFARLLSGYLGSAAPVVIAALEGQPVQAYLQVVDTVDAEVNASLRSFMGRISAALRSAPTA